MTLIKKIFIELSSCFKGGPEAENGMEIGTENDYQCLSQACQDMIQHSMKHRGGQQQEDPW